MSSATINGLQIDYEISGDGEGTIVLAAGLGMPPVVWELCGLKGALEAAGYRVLTYVARGVAPSDAPPSPYSIRDLAEDLGGLLDQLGLRGCRLVGYSLGGYVAELLARTRPDLIRSTVLLAGAGPLSPVLRTIDETAAAFIEQLGDIPAPFTRWQDFMTALPPATLRDDEEQVDLWWQLGVGPRRRVDVERREARAVGRGDGLVARSRPHEPPARHREPGAGRVLRARPDVPAPGWEAGGGRDAAGRVRRASGSRACGARLPSADLHPTDPRVPGPYMTPAPGGTLPPFVRLRASTAPCDTNGR